MNATVIPHLALESARRFPDKPAVQSPGLPALTYAGLADQMRAAAGGFIASGIAVGDRIAIWAPNIEQWIVAALGAQAAGAVLVPLNTRYKGGEAAYILRASGARILLTVSGFLGHDYPRMIADENLEGLERILLLDGAGPDGWDRFLELGRSVAAEDVEARLASLSCQHVSDILFTSGTTGKPKGVVTTHLQNLAVYRDYSSALGWTDEDRLLAINPFFHSFGYKAGWLCSIMRGSTLYPVTIFDAAGALDIIERERITLTPGPPTIFQSMLDLDLDRRDLSSLRLAVTGATIVPAPLLVAMKERLGHRHILTAYGLTETCGVVSMCDTGDDIETISTTSGRAIPGVDVKIADRDGAPVAPGLPGDIMVRGYNVMKGYFENPEATAEALDAEGWLRTGDIGIMRDDGCISITDRSKDVYICGGFNVYPAEVEQLLAAHPDVSEAAVIGVHDTRLGEVGHAFLVLRSDASIAGSGAEDALLRWSREAMANFKAPRAINLVGALPRNASGKVEKYKLKEMI